MQPIPVLIWTCVAVFAATAVITILGLIGIITLGGGDGDNHDYYLKRLFGILIVEIVGVAVAVFTTNVGINKNYVDTLENAVANRLTIADSLSNRLSISNYPSLFADSSMIIAADEPNLPLNEGGGVVTGGPASIITDTLQATVLASSDKSPTSKTIQIPEGWQYVEHNTITRNRNGDTSFDIELSETNGSIRDITLIASAEEKSFFRPRNWIMITLQVVIEKQ